MVLLQVLRERVTSRTSVPGKAAILTVSQPNSLQLASSLKVSRNFNEKKSTCAVFLDVAKAFSTQLVDGLLYKLTVLNFPSYPVNTISSYLHYWMFEASFQTDTSTRRVMRAGVDQGGIISPFLFSLYVKDMPATSHHIKLVIYADDAAIVATYCKATLIVSYLESCFNDLKRLLRKWIALNFSKSTAMLFVKI